MPSGQDESLVIVRRFYSKQMCFNLPESSVDYKQVCFTLSESLVDNKEIYF